MKTLADFLVERGVSVVVTGGADEVEMEYVNPFVNSTSRQVFNVAGRIKLADAAELLKHSKLYAGPDTAITHLASFFGCSHCCLVWQKPPARCPFPFTPSLRSAPGVDEENASHGEYSCHHRRVRLPPERAELFGGRPRDGRVHEEPSTRIRNGCPWIHPPVNPWPLLCLKYPQRVGGC